MRTTLLAAVLAVPVVAGAPGAAGAVGSAPACPEREVARHFAWALDPNLYFPMPHGDFEDGGRTWSLGGGARVVDGSSQALRPTSADHTRSLQLPPGGQAGAAPLCVEGTATVMRFFARSRGLAGAAVVTVTARGGNGGSQTLVSPALPLTREWSAPLLLFRLPVLGDGHTSVTVSIRSVGLAPIDIDDVYVDPLKQH